MRGKKSQCLPIKTVSHSLALPPSSSEVPLDIDPHDQQSDVVFPLCPFIEAAKNGATWLGEEKRVCPAGGEGEGGEGGEGIGIEGEERCD